MEESTSTKYPCAICTDEVAEEEVVKHCDGKHIFCRECFKAWTDTFTGISNYGSTKSNEHYFFSTEDGKVDIEASNIPDLIPMHIVCPICRNYLKTDYHDYTGSVTKDVPFVHNSRFVHKAECSYLNGKKHGPYRQWTEKETLAVECNFQHGHIEGIFKCWLTNGRKEFTYVDGKKHGKTWFYSAKNGKVYDEYIYDHGRLLRTKSFWENGNIKSDVGYDDDGGYKWDGINITGHKNGRVSSISYWKKGVQYGLYQKFDTDGNLVSEKDYGEEPV